jgi:hypothetical protein
MKTPRLAWTTLVVALALFHSACKNNPEIPTPPNEPEQTAPKLRKAIGSETDFQQLDYDSSGRITQYVSQWQFVQSDPSQIKRLVYTFEYNAAGQLNTVRSKGDMHSYFYKNGILERIESRMTNRLISTTNFLFDEKGRVVEREEVMPDEQYAPELPSKTKWKYTYDTKGNCIHEDYFLFMDNKYQLYESTEHTEFDNSANPFDRLSFFPYVPWVKFQVNNPGKRTVTASSGGQPRITAYRYQYDSKGIPTQRTVSTNGADWTVKLEY